MTVTTKNPKLEAGSQAAHELVEAIKAAEQRGYVNGRASKVAENKTLFDALHGLANWQFLNEHLPQPDAVEMMLTARQACEQIGRLP